MVVVQHSAEPLPNLDTAHGLRHSPADNPVSDALVAAFVVIVLRVLLDGPVEQSLLHEDHLAETLGLDPPFTIGKGSPVTSGPPSENGRAQIEGVASAVS